MKRALLAIMIVAGVLTGCKTADFRTRRTCDATRVQMFVGALGTGDVGGLATERSYAKSLRWLRPGMAVTMDYRADRLNIEVDDRNFIRSLRCG